MAWEPEPPRRRQILSLRLSDEERTSLEREAERAGESSISNTVRRIMHAYFEEHKR